MQALSGPCPTGKPTNQNTSTKPVSTQRRPRCRCLIELVDLNISTPNGSSVIRAFHLRPSHCHCHRRDCHQRSPTSWHGKYHQHLAPHHRMQCHIVEEGTFTNLTSSLEFGTATTCDDEPLTGGRVEFEPTRHKSKLGLPRRNILSFRWIALVSSFRRYHPATASHKIEIHTGTSGGT